MTCQVIQDMMEENAIANLEWLSKYEPPNKHLPEGVPLVGGVPARMLRDLMELPIIDCGLTKDLLTAWTKMNMETIDHAKSKQVFGGKADIDWRTAFLPFMESITMYLRDVSLHMSAWNKYRGFKASEGTKPHLKDEAVQDFLDSTKDIRAIADLWDMDFQVLCDFPGHHPSGHPDWDGPYCGLFTSRRADPDAGGRPFQGIAFKGTGPISPDQWMVDFNYQLAAAAGGYLKGASVSQGVFATLFGRYENPDVVPYQAVRDLALKSAAALSAQAGGGAPTVTHVTGHSLGASYATMCNAQLLIDMPAGAGAGAGPPPLAMGDTYTFGSPRVGGDAWAVLYETLVGRSKGLTWRVVNAADLVPTVPPTSLRAGQLDFHHVDAGVQIFRDGAPARLPTEVNGPNPPPVAFDGVVALAEDIAHSVDHLPTGYYNALQEAMKPSAAVPGNGVKIQSTTSVVDLPETESLKL